MPIARSTLYRCLKIGVVLVAIILMASLCWSPGSQTVRTDSTVAAGPQPNQTRPSTAVTANPDLDGARQIAAEFTRLYLSYSWDQPLNQAEAFRPLVTEQMLNELTTNSSAQAGQADLANRQEVGVATVDSAEVQITLKDGTVTAWAYAQLNVTHVDGQETYPLQLTLSLIRQGEGWLVAEVEL